MKYITVLADGVFKDTLNRAKVNYRMLILPTDPAPICIRAYASDPAPYLLYDSRSCV